jgi:hypothetical protein
MNNSRSQRRNSQSRERDSRDNYSDPRNGRQNPSFFSDPHQESRSFRQDRDYQGRFNEYQNDYHRQGRYENEDSSREPRYTYSQHPSDSVRGSVRNAYGYPNEYMERNYSNSFSRRNPNFEYIEQERYPQGRYYRSLENSQYPGSRYEDQNLESAQRFSTSYENGSNPRYDEFYDERNPERYYDNRNQYSY